MSRFHAQEHASRVSAAGFPYPTCSLSTLCDLPLIHGSPGDMHWPFSSVAAPATTAIAVHVAPSGLSLDITTLSARNGFSGQSSLQSMGPAHQLAVSNADCFENFPEDSDFKVSVFGVDGCWMDVLGMLQQKRDLPLYCHQVSIYPDPSHSMGWRSAL